MAEEPKAGSAPPAPARRPGGPLLPEPGAGLPLKWLAVAAVAAVVLVAVFWPRVPPCGDALDPDFATKVAGFDAGRIEEGSPFLDARCALGPPDNRFVSLGIGGRLVLELGTPAKSVEQLLIYEYTGVNSRPWTPVPVQQVEGRTLYAVTITASPAWPFGGDETVYVSFDPESGTPAGFTRVVLTDLSREPVKLSAGAEIDAVQVTPRLAETESA